MAGAAAVGWHAFSTASDALEAHSALRLAETAVITSVFGWYICCLAVGLLITLAAELRGRGQGADVACDPCRLHRQEAGHPLLVLVPSYREEVETIWQTLMSAALAEHPHKDIVLLIDDPDQPSTSEAARLLADARSLPAQLQKLFDAAAEPHEAALAAFRARGPAEDEGLRLAACYREAALWIERQAKAFRLRHGANLGHTDRLFHSRILEAPAAALRFRADLLAHASADGFDAEGEYLRLAALFRMRFSSFERKRYANLSHAPNKAMNLNSYLALMGRSFRDCGQAGERRLALCSASEATLTVPDYEFVVTIDADSLITHDYNLCLLDVMRRPGAERIAIAQSPYTAVPGASSAIEHAAAASTDGQFFSHQGLAALGTSSWVGASALMRTAALRDIVVTRMERGHPVEIYIKDDILIEDAAATIDLLRKNWRIHHSPNRLSYSATPADFGALVIQRRRWANGGLLILPRLLGVFARHPLSPRSWVELLFRTPHLTSAATNSVFAMMMLLLPFDDRVLPPWLSLVMIPSLLMTLIELRRAGYRPADLIAVQALAVLLIPVNAAGTLQSLRQALTGRPVPFARTPKIAGRTRPPRFYVIAVLALIAYATIFGLIDLMARRFAHAGFELFNATVFSYCLVRFMGLRTSLEDLGLAGLLRQVPDPTCESQDPQPSFAQPWKTS